MDGVCCQPTIYLKPCFIMLRLMCLRTMSAFSHFQQNITFRKSNPFAFSREKAGASIQFGLLGYLITDNNGTGFFSTPVFSTFHLRTESLHFPETFSCYQYNSVGPFFYLSRYLTNLMHKICFIISFISCLYMFWAHVLIIRRSKLHYTSSGIITPIA
jgi:hypothetical protein